jgi:hypothetical protein
MRKQELLSPESGRDVVSCVLLPVAATSVNLFLVLGYRDVPRVE